MNYPGEAAAQQDDLDFRSVIRIFVRTWPFIRPMLRHLGFFVAASVFLFLFSALFGLVINGVMQGSLIAGKPLGGWVAALYGLDPAAFVNVDALSDAARLELPWIVVNTTIVALIVLVAGGIALYYYTIWIFQQINQLMRMRLIENLHAQSLTYHAQARTGDAIYRTYQDSAMVTQIIQAIFLEPLTFIGRYLFGVAVMAAFDPTIALILGLTMLPIMWLGWAFSSPLRIGFREARETNSDLTSWIQESVAGIRLIKATGNEKQRQASFDEHSNRAFAAAFDARSRLALFGILTFMLVGLAVLASQSLMALWSSAEADVFAKRLLIGFGFAAWNLGAFNAALGRLGDGVGSLRSLLATWGRAQDMAVGLGRVFEILDLVPEIKDADDAAPMAPFRDQVAFEGVSYNYREGVPVLTDISITARRGTVTALVGPTGAGKSTLMSLLLRLADPRTGRVTIDGVDVRKITLDSLRQGIAIATQENILFSDTVAENIRYAVPDASRQAVVEAATISCADEFIQSLANGYETSLGEKATKLSSGQRQRLVIARALIKNAPILILDEPTASLDAETEQQVLANLKAWAKNRCIFLITHRLSTIRQSDQVAYIRNGALLEFGSHDEMMQHADGPYRRFVEAETGQADEVQS